MFIQASVQYRRCSRSFVLFFFKLILLNKLQLGHHIDSYSRSYKYTNKLQLGHNIDSYSRSYKYTNKLQLVHHIDSYSRSYKYTNKLQLVYHIDSYSRSYKYTKKFIARKNNPASTLPRLIQQHREGEN